MILSICVLLLGGGASALLLKSQIGQAALGFTGAACMLSWAAFWLLISLWLYQAADVAGRIENAPERPLYFGKDRKLSHADAASSVLKMGDSIRGPL